MISDDDLLLYYYRDGLDAAERARIGAALAEQPELAQRLHRLVAASTRPRRSRKFRCPRHGSSAGAPRWSRQPREQTPMSRPLPPALHGTCVGSRPRRRRSSRSSVVHFSTRRRRNRPPSHAARRRHRPTGERRLRLRARSEVASREHGAATRLARERERPRSARDSSKRSSSRTASTRWPPSAPASRSSRACCARSRRFSKACSEGGDSIGGVSQLAFELRVMQGRLAAGTAPRTPPTTL